jgi:hypothetical protein
VTRLKNAAAASPDPRGPLSLPEKPAATIGREA